MAAIVTCVALLAEGVDRNSYNAEFKDIPNGSPSSRRAWIEIQVTSSDLPRFGSPSSRRAWIEIRKP